MWVSLREKTKMVESKMVEFKLAEFNLAAIIKLSQKKWVKFFCAKWLNPIWQNSRWLPSLSSVRMNEEVFVVQNGWIQVGRIQDGWNHQFESEWMSEVFLCKCWELILASVSEFERKTKMVESKIAKFKMAAIIKLSQNEWVKYFLCKWWEPILASVSEFERKN